MRPGIRFQAYLVAAIPLVFLVAVLALALLIQGVSAEAAAGEQQTQQVVRQVEQVQALISQAGRSADSYTGPADEAKLASLHAAQAQMPAAFDRLGALTADEPGIAQYVAELRAASEDGMALVSRYLGALRAGHAQEARAIDSAPSTRALNTRLVTSTAALITAQRNFELARLQVLRNHILRYEYALIALTAIAIVLTLFTTGRFGLGLVQRVRQLAQNAELLAAQQPAQPLEGNDEFADLDRVYRAMMQRIAREQRIASTLQRALLPQTLPVTQGIRIDSAYVPAADDMEVGGDWYDVFPLSPRKLCVSVGDVAGHGLRAAALMAVSRIAVRTAARVDERPAEILRYVNRVVSADEPNTLVTAFVGVLDITTGDFTFATAGHPPPMVITPDERARYLESEGFVLGADPKAEFEERSSRLSEGCALVVYTDGVVEVDRDYAKGQNDLMNAALSEYVESPGNIAEAILHRVMGTKRPLDDAAIVFIGISQLSGEVSRRAATWKLDARDQASAHRVKRAMLWQLGQSISARQDLSGVELIFGELLGNVARHTPGAAEVSLEYRDDGHALLHICDEGMPFKFHPNGALDLLSEGGRGLMIADSLSDGLSIERTQTGNRVTAVLPVTTA